MHGFSNHTGRRPDTCAWVGEGVFFGLGSKSKFPQTTLEAPYTLAAAGVTLPPQRFQVRAHTIRLRAHNP